MQRSSMLRPVTTIFLVVNSNLRTRSLSISVSVLMKIMKMVAPVAEWLKTWT